MRERGNAAATLERSAVRMEPQAVPPSARPEALAEGPALVRAPVHGVVRSELPAGLAEASALAPTHVPAFVRTLLSDAVQRALQAKAAPVVSAVQAALRQRTSWKLDSVRALKQRSAQINHLLRRDVQRR